MLDMLHVGRPGANVKYVGRNMDLKQRRYKLGGVPVTAETGAGMR